MSDGMGRELAYLSSHATNRYFIPNWGKILEHHYHAFQEPWGEGEKVILQKEDIMQYSKEEIK